MAEYTLGVALLNRDAAADRHRGLELMAQARDIWLRERVLFLVPVTGLWAAGERARRDDVVYWELRDCYRAMATSLGFEVHMAWARAMP